MTAQTSAWRTSREAGARHEDHDAQPLLDPAELELAPAADIIEWAVATFGSRFCVTSSMSDAVLADWLGLDAAAIAALGLPIAVTTYLCLAENLTGADGPDGGADRHCAHTADPARKPTITR